MYNDFINNIESFLNKDKRTVIAIEGRAASGKTTLANYLAKKYNITVFHIDDFFLPLKLQTQERLSEVGENIDHERFLYEVLLPLKSEEPSIALKKFNCKIQSLEPTTIVNASNVIIVEGVYCLNKNLRDYYDYKVFIDVNIDLQHKRLKDRSSIEVYNKFVNKWLPLEDKYFNADIKKQCDIVIPTSEIII